jgi:hypothetical protein
MQIFPFPTEFLATQLIITFESKTIDNSLTSFLFTSQQEGQPNSQRKTIVLNKFHQQDWIVLSTALLAMGNFTCLSALKFHTPCFSEETMIALLEKSSSLHTLEMGGKDFDHSDQLLVAIGAFCKKLECLNLSYSSKITHRGIQHLNNCTLLREVNFSACSNISDDSLEMLASTACDSLKTLILYHCPQITDRTIQAIYSHCHKLKYLNIGYCEQVSSDQIFQLFLSCPFLEALFLEHLSIQMDKLFQTEAIPQLKKLSLRHTDINDQDLLLLSKQAPCLSQLNLSECHLISLRGMIEGISQLTKLQLLDIRGCLLSASEIDELRTLFPSLTIVGDFISIV